MTRLWQFIWHGCWHRWGPSLGYVDHYDISFGHKSFMYRGHTVKCEKCGRYHMLKDHAGASE